MEKTFKEYLAEGLNVSSMIVDAKSLLFFFRKNLQTWKIIADSDTILSFFKEKNEIKVLGKNLKQEKPLVMSVEYYVDSELEDVFYLMYEKDMYVNPSTGRMNISNNVNYRRYSETIKEIKKKFLSF